jgi:hypothetical protein
VIAISLQFLISQDKKVTIHLIGDERTITGKLLANEVDFITILDDNNSKIEINQKCIR